MPAGAATTSAKASPRPTVPVTETDCARLLDATHQQLAGPIVMVWDNLNVHISDSMTGLVAARDGLTRPAGSRRMRTS